MICLLSDHQEGLAPLSRQSLTMISTDIFPSPSRTASSQSKQESACLEQAVVSEDKGGASAEVLPVDDDGGCPDGGLRAWLVVLGVR